MLFIKGIYLLLSHLPTFHTTVRAVPHTAVSRFYTLRCVASCFQPSLRDTSEWEKVMQRYEKAGRVPSIRELQKEAARIEKMLGQ